MQTSFSAAAQNYQMGWYSINPLVLYMVDIRFKSWDSHHLSSLRLSLFSSNPPEKYLTVPWLSLNFFFPNPFQCIILQSLYNSILSSLGYWQGSNESAHLACTHMHTHKATCFKVVCKSMITKYYFFFFLLALQPPHGGCILQPSSGL